MPKKNTPQNRKKNTHKREKQTRYLSQAIQLEEAVNPHIIKATMSMVSLAIMAFVIWAAFTNINEIARTPGEVVPFGYQQNVQHLEGGIIKSINVHEGEIVEKEQVMITLNPAGLKEDLERAQQKQLSLNLEAERLRAFVENRKPDYSAYPEASKNMITDQTSFFEGMKNSRRQETQVIHEQIREKQQSLKLSESDLASEYKNLEIANDVYQRRNTLNQKGYASDIQTLEDKRRVNEIQGNIERLKNQKALALTAIREYQRRLSSLSAGHKDEAYQKLSAIVTEAEQNQKVIDKLQDKLQRLEIKAPSRGLVKGLEVNTIGAVIKPGETIMEIVPLDKNFEVQVKISPQDIGHIRVGQPVQVKFSTYDFSRYGSVDGKLEHISATTFSGTNGERFYQGRIALEQDHVGGSQENRIMPGMTVMADVITGEKTILQYLLKPIHISLKTAFTER